MSGGIDVRLSGVGCRLCSLFQESIQDNSIALVVRIVDESRDRLGYGINDAVGVDGSGSNVIDCDNGGKSGGACSSSLF